MLEVEIKSVAAFGKHYAVAVRPIIVSLKGQFRVGGELVIPSAQNITAGYVDFVPQFLGIRRCEQRNGDRLVQVPCVNIPLQGEEVLFAWLQIETESTAPHLPTVVGGRAIGQD